MFSYSASDEAGRTIRQSEGRATCSAPVIIAGSLSQAAFPRNAVAGIPWSMVPGSAGGRTLMFQTYGISHIQITVGDLDRSARFYQGLLGMKELRRFDHSVMMQTPGSREVITLNARPEPPLEAGRMGGIAHFGFR